MASLHPKIYSLRVRKHLRLFVSPGGLPGVVAAVGSIDLGPETEPRKKLSASFAASLLDEGTKKRNKQKIQEFLDDRGAKISFSAEGRHLLFSLQSLRKDFPDVLMLLSEMLESPNFGAREFELVKKRILTNFHQEQENTYLRAKVAMAKKLYPAGHPNAQSTVDELISLASKISRPDVSKYWESIKGSGDILMVTVGDVLPSIVERAAKKAFAFWSGTESARYRLPMKPIENASEQQIEIPHKASIDVVLGSRLWVSRENRDFYPLTVLMSLLGSDFSARLFQEVREKRGLTYGIYSRMEGFGDFVDGFWYVWGTFAPHLFPQGRAAIDEVLAELVKNGVSAKEVKYAKQKLIGRYLIDLSVPTKFAGAILSSFHNDVGGISHLAAWRDRISKVTTADVNRVIAKYIHPEKLVVAAAGTFSKPKK